MGSGVVEVSVAKRRYWGDVERRKFWDACLNGGACRHRR